MITLVDLKKLKIHERTSRSRLQAVKKMIFAFAYFREPIIVGKKNFFILEILLILILVSWPRTASAYLDPGTGSYIIQVILAAIFGSIFAIKMYYYQIKNFFKKFT